MKRKFTKLTAALALLAFLAVPMGMWGQTYEALVTFDCADASNNGTQSLYGQPTTSLTAAYLKAFLNAAAGETAVASTSSISNVYWTKGSGGSNIPDDVLKIGKASAAGSFTFVIPDSYDQISKVSISGYGWKNTTAVSVNGSAAQTTSNAATLYTFDYVLTAATRTITISVSSSAFCATEIVLYKTTGGGGGQQPTTYNVTYAAGDHGNGTMTDNNSPYAAGDQVTLLANTFTPENGYQWDSWEVKDANDQTVTVNNGVFTMPASNVTVTAQWTQTGGGSGSGDQWVLTPLADLAAGDVFVIVGNNGSNYAMSNDNGTGSAPSAVAVSVSGNNLTGTIASNIQWNISGDATNGYTFYPNGDNANWLYCTNTNNGVRVGTNNSKTFTVEDGYLKHSGTSRFVGIFNSTDWRCYTSHTGTNNNIDNQTFAFYKKVSSTPTITFTPASIALGNVPVNQQITETFTVAQANLSAGITLSANVGSLDVNSIAQGAAATQVTWTYTPASAGAINATITANSGNLQETLVITGTAKTAHNITIANMSNGSVTASANSAIEGQTITLTVTPDAGYTLDALTVTNNTTNTQVTVTNNTFEMPDAPVTVSATFIQIQAMTVAQALAAAAPQNGVFVHGYISQIDEVEINQYHNATYWISDDGTTTGQMKVYHGKYLNNDPFTAIDQIGVGDEVVVTGNISEYQNANQLASGNYIVSLIQAQPFTLSLGTHTNISEFFMFAGTESNDIEFDQNGEVEINAGTTVYVSVETEECYVTNGLNVTYGNNQTATVTTLEPHVYYSFVMPEDDATLNFVTAQAQQYELTVGTLTNVTLEMTAGEESEEVEDGDEICEGSNVTIEATAEQGYVLQSVNVRDGNNDPVTVNSHGNGVYSFTMPSSNVTVSATAVARTLNTYSLATSITSGSTYIITNGVNKAMGYQKSNNRDAKDALISAGVANVGSENIATETTDQLIYEFVIERYENTNYYTIYDAVNGGYLYAANSNSNQLKTKTQVDDNCKWDIQISNGVATLVAQGTNSRNIMRFNPNNGTPLFTCYGSNNAGDYDDIYLYVKAVNPQTQTYTKQIAAYQGAGGYNLIASPVVGVVPTASNGFLTNAYDFYYFDQAQQDEWRNFEAGSFDLISGKGYLYASATATTLTFTGVPYNGNGQVALTYDANADLPGWNLIGNPFPATAYLSDSRSFYEMKADGTEIIANLDDEIAAMEGIFVVAADGNDNSVTFTTTAPAQTESIVLNVSRNRNEAIDRAIVRFGEGGQLPKFQLNPNNTKIYITEGDQEYAVVRSGNDAEIPVSFSASENGTYTISVNAENMEMTYLHLIDNMTGADVDLLATPSYTFEAKTTDYASRFRLVFSASSTSSETAEAFAFFNGSEWTISNIGEATLQVVDVMGRILSTETVNGNATINVNQPTGVYMLRLVNGNNVRTQKVVVR